MKIPRIRKQRRIMLKTIAGIDQMKEDLRMLNKHVRSGFSKEDIDAIVFLLNETREACVWVRNRS